MLSRTKTPIRRILAITGVAFLFLSCSRPELRHSSGTLSTQNADLSASIEAEMNRIRENLQVLQYLQSTLPSAYPPRHRELLEHELKLHRADPRRQKQLQQLLKELKLYQDDLEAEIRMYSDVGRADFFQPETNKTK